jgi:hypothetical protein
MKAVSKEMAEGRVVEKYNKLYSNLIDLVTALNVMEPGGTLVDDVVFTVNEGKKVSVAYVATPIQVTINTPERKFILRVVESPGHGNSISIKPSNIEKRIKQLKE